MMSDLSDKKHIKAIVYIVLGTMLLLYNFGLFQQFGNLIAVLGSIGLIIYGLVLGGWHITLYNFFENLFKKSSKH